MRVLGVTGGTGTGKSTVCKILAEQGGVIIDADKIAAQQQRRGSTAFSEIVEHFGKEILLPDGELNRTLLAGIVFSDKKELRLLNGIVHKYVSAEMKAQVELARSENARFAVLDVPIPIEDGFFDTADCVVGGRCKRRSAHRAPCRPQRHKRARGAAKDKRPAV